MSPVASRHARRTVRILHALLACLFLSAIVPYMATPVARAVAAQVLVLDAVDAREATDSASSHAPEGDYVARPRRIPATHVTTTDPPPTPPPRALARPLSPRVPLYLRHASLLR